MKGCARRFNTYLALAAAAGLFPGCQSAALDKTAPPVAALQVYIEAAPDGVSATQTVSVVRSHPMSFTIPNAPILTEADIAAANVIAAQDGFAIRLQFDETGTMLLEQYTASYLGKHLVIRGQWGKTAADSRWLAAPLITHRIGDGVLVFTADASRTEADRLVLGLNGVIKKLHKGELK